MTCQAPAPVTASMVSESSPVVSVTTDVTSTVSGPTARSAWAASITSSRVCVSRPVRKSSSKWLGVTICAWGTTRSRMNSGIPGRTKNPRPTSPITGSQQ